LQVVAQRRFDRQDVGIGDLQAVGQRSQDMLALLERGEGTGSETLMLGGQLLQNPQLRALFGLLSQQRVAFLSRLNHLRLKSPQAQLALLQGHARSLDQNPFGLDLLGELHALHLQANPLLLELDLLRIELLQADHVALELERQLIDLVADAPQTLRRRKGLGLGFAQVLLTYRQFPLDGGQGVPPNGLLNAQPLHGSE